MAIISRTVLADYMSFEAPLEAGTVVRVIGVEGDSMVVEDVDGDEALVPADDVCIGGNIDDDGTCVTCGWPITMHEPE